jgi:exopolysaccharide biosynthesis WecB/TagA/CpsF family protein
MQLPRRFAQRVPQRAHRDPHQVSQAARPSRPWTSFGWVSLAGDLLCLLDGLCLGLLTPLAVNLATGWPLRSGSVLDLSSDQALTGLALAGLAPFLLYQPRFGLQATRGQWLALMHAHVLRILALSAGGVAIGLLSHTLGPAGAGVWSAWCITALLSTCGTRWLLARSVRALQRKGALSEVVAVVGAGPVADRLLLQLRRVRPDSIELLGVFDDARASLAPGSVAATGSVADLIELGRTRRIDWIVLTLPPTAHRRIQAMVQRLKALATPIGLCPQDIGLAMAPGQLAYLGEHLPVSVVADRSRGRRDAWLDIAEDLLPRWLVSLALLPRAGLDALAARRPVGPAQLHLAAVSQAPTAAAAPLKRLSLAFDPFDLDGFSALAADFGQTRFGYVVTPNADHLIRLSEDAAFRALYAQADFTLLDSRFLAHVLRLSQGLELPVCTGSDLTERLFSRVIDPDDGIVLIGASADQARRLALRYGLRRLAHYNPPMGFSRDPAEVTACLDFIEAHSPFRFCFLALGSPQQEKLAQALKARGLACGLALCIGASINFLTGEERRAPRWMRRSGLEWSYRLMQAPRRMAHRYLVRGPRVFGLVRRAEIVVRRPAVVPPSVPPAAQPLPLPLPLPLVTTSQVSPVAPHRSVSCVS